MVWKNSYSKPRVLIVGLGSIGKRHLRILREIYVNIEVIALRRESSLTESDLEIDFLVHTIS